MAQNSNWISEREFRRIHRTWHRSVEAKQLKHRLYARQQGHCARCWQKRPPRGFQLNLTSYESMKRGRPVKDAEANLLCKGCHPKGTYTWQKLRADKSFDWELKIIEWVILGPFRLAWWLFRSVWRIAMSRMRRRNP